MTVCNNKLCSRTGNPIIHTMTIYITSTGFRIATLAYIICETVSYTHRNNISVTRQHTKLKVVSFGSIIIIAYYDALVTEPAV